MHYYILVNILGDWCKILILGSCTPLLGAGKLSVGTTEFPFSVELRSGTGQQLVETFHGVHVIASYVLK